MARTRRVVRRLASAEGATFEDQTWTVNVALLAMAGFVAGLIIATSKFDDPRWLYNGWVRLASLAISLGLVVWLAAIAEQRWMGRRLQFAGLLSLVFHLVLVFTLSSQELTYLLQGEPVAEQAPAAEEYEVVLLPDYQEPELSNEPQEHERAVQVADAEGPTVEVNSRPDLPAVPIAAELKHASAENKEDSHPSPIQLREVLDSAPKQDRESSLFSKQLARAELKSPESIPLEQAAAAPSLPKLDAKVSAAKAEPILAKAQEPKTAELPGPQPKTVELARRESSQDAPKINVARESIERTSTTVRAVTTAKPIDVAPAVTQQVQEVTAPDSAVARTAASAPAPSAELQQPREHIAARVLQVAPSERVVQLSVDAAAPRAREPARALRAAEAEASPVRLESPALAEGEGERPQFEPQRTALSRGAVGVFGGGHDPNFDRGLPADLQPTVTAGAAARREIATQSAQPGSAASPSLPARISRSLAGVQVPTATLIAEQNPDAPLAGSRELSKVEASAGATIVRADAQAEPSPMTAAAGTSTIDVGSPQVAASIGAGRSAGGGAPLVSTEAGRKQVAKSTLGGVRIAALAAELPSPVPEARPGVGGGAPAPSPRADSSQPAGTGSGASAPGDLAQVGEQIGSANPGLTADRIGAVFRRTDGSTGQPAQAAGASGPLRRALTPAPGAGTAIAQTEGPSAKQSESQSSNPSSPAPGPAATEARKNAAGPLELAMAGAANPTGSPSGGLPVEVAASLGPGGLGSDVTSTAGSPSRKAQPDALVVHAGTARFLGRKFGGAVAIDSRAREPAAAFAGRSGNRFGKGSSPGRPSARTEAAIELGLDFLARHQEFDGSWSLNRFGSGRPGYQGERASFTSDTAATGLALLSFLGAGYDHYDDFYRDVVQGGLSYLVKRQQRSGELYVPTGGNSDASARLYSHGIAAIALCEAYGMTGDDNLREPAQRAIDFIVYAQDPRLGGWRYNPQTGSDTSVSGWQLMALKSGELAGLRVPRSAFDRARGWLNVAQAPVSEGSEYVYNPYAPSTPEQAHGRYASPAMTAVGLLMRLYLGWNRNEPRMTEGAERLLENLPALTDERDRDTYYWYYATQVMFHMKGKYWQQWNQRLHPLLADSQVKEGVMAGSWHPLAPVPDRWGIHGGRIYVTTLNLLSLEVYYRHLPIYESTAR